MAETAFALGRFLGMAEITNPETQTVQIAKETADLERKEIKKTAGAIKESAVELVDSADRTTRLAADRTVLAAERTYAAWVRTGLFALASGIGARALLTGLMPEWLILADASVLIAFSVFCFGAAIWRYLNPGPPPPIPDVARIPDGVLITVNAFLGVVSLAALIGIWAVPG